MNGLETLPCLPLPLYPLSRPGSPSIAPFIMPVIPAATFTTSSMGGVLEDTGIALQKGAEGHSRTQATHVVGSSNILPAAVVMTYGIG